jgi:glucose-1-phosphate thymidylyltransferase
MVRLPTQPLGKQRDRLFIMHPGTYESLMEAGTFVEVIERRQGLKVACLEEIAYSMWYITVDQLVEQGNRLKNSQYGQYILEICQRERKR